ncbi:hypothetical protein KKB99_03610, partial [bacterium]|nr:hypothetical protein [bacterium]MBU1025078.1 hypothetical protein [bacterium]
MKCPNCGGPMWDNTQNKKNPKAPDFKCKDKNCVDPETGYVTAVWLPKVKGVISTPKTQPTPQRTQNKPIVVNSTDPEKMTKAEWKEKDASIIA